MNSYPSHTPELSRLLADMLCANAALSKVARRNPLAAFRSPEYKASRVAYRAYWSAVDAASVSVIVGQGGQLVTVSRLC
jgi:hypothetical protein